MTDKNNNITIGRYLLSPLTRPLDNGRYASSLSIRSGSGRGTTDRVLRFIKTFRSDAAAAEYALAEGRQWIGGAT